MALDPLIANPSSVKLADPMELYGNFLRNQYLQSEIQKARVANNQNILQQQAWNPKFNPGVIDANNQPDFGLAMRYLGEHGGGPGVTQLGIDQYTTAAKKAEAAMNQAKAGEFTASTQAKQLENLHNSLGDVDWNNPQNGVGQYINHARNYITDPSTMQMLKSRGVDPQDFFNQTQQAAQQAAAGGPVSWKQFGAAQQDGIAKTYEQSVTPQDLGNIKLLLNTGKFGGPASVVKGSVGTVGLTPGEQTQRNEIQYTTLDNGQTKQVIGMSKYAGGPAPGLITSTQMQMTPAQQAQYDPTLASARAASTSLTNDVTKDFMNQHMTALQLPQMVKHIDDALGLLVPGKSITGMGQTWYLDARRAADLFGLDPKVADTQVLNKKLNEFVLDQLRNGATSGRTTNMITKLVQDSNATGQMSPQAIHDVLMSKRQDIQSQMQRHNDLTNQLLGSNIGSTMSGLGMKPLPSIPEYGPNAAKGENGRPISSASILDLIMNPQHANQFDQAFGAGSADKILGGTPTGATPFPPAGR